MIVQVFVSLDGVNYNILDTDKIESIPMRYTFKDTQDISKVFAPYSLGFSIGCTPKNLRNLGYFGNTDVLKITDLKKLKCKIYVNSILNQKGILKLEKISYKKGKPEVITASFNSNLTDLKSKLGDDTINTLGSYAVEWNSQSVFNRLQSIESSFAVAFNFGLKAIKWFVPLASTNRVWQYDNAVGSNVLDNVFFKSGVNPKDNRVIKPNELRPAITFSTIVELIKNKYNLSISAPLESRTEYKDAYVWCMGENFSLGQEVKFIIKQNKFITGLNYASAFNIRVTALDSSVKVKKPILNANKNYFIQTVTLQNINYLSENTNVTITIVRRGESVPIITNVFEMSSTVEENFNMEIPDIYLDSNREIDYFIYLNFNRPLTWGNSILRVGIFIVPSSTTTDVVLYVNPNNNYSDMQSSKVDLIRALPEIKVIDFLTSYLKAFNISILDVTPENDDLVFYTPQDILANKKTETYNADISEVDKSIQDDFDYYVFQHAKSNFKSNIDYKIGAGIDYAKTAYPVIKPENAKEYKVETNFTLIPPVTVVGTSDVVTYYGFEGSNPELLNTGEARYTPNFGELPIFYSHGSAPLNRSFLVQSANSGTLFTSSISSYIKCLPFTTDLKSFAFSVLVFKNISYPNNLFSRYYFEIIKRYIDQNVMKQEFSLTLTTKQINDFRLENDIIIGENRFSIIDSTIDITSGKTKLTLLNY